VVMVVAVETEAMEATEVMVDKEDRVDKVDKVERVEQAGKEEQADGEAQAEQEDQVVGEAPVERVDKEVRADGEAQVDRVEAVVPEEREEPLALGVQAQVQARWALHRAPSHHLRRTRALLLPLLPLRSLSLPLLPYSPCCSIRLWPMAIFPISFLRLCHKSITETRFSCIIIPSRSFRQLPSALFKGLLCLNH
jgi:hypothetical protein